MIIGITGSYCAGKDVVADYLIKNKGFTHYSLSDALREYLKEKNIEPTRENLINNGKLLRETEGNEVLAKRIALKFEEGKDFVVTSLRHPSEIKYFYENSSFVLIKVDASAELRFKRMQIRKREGDPKTFEEFLNCEKRESQSSGSGQQLVKCGEMAKYTLINDVETLDVLYKKIENLLDCIRKEKL